MRHIKSWRLYGLVTFILMMAYLLLVAWVPQHLWGLWGVGVTQLVLLTIAIAAWVCTKRPFHEVFPLHKPTAPQVGGSLLVWAGAFFVTTGLSSVMVTFMPEIIETNNYISNIISAEPFLVQLLLVGLAPAVCEEAIHRGVILSSMDRIRAVWPRVLLMGLAFGLFHADVYRFVPTTLLGMAITFAMIKTGTLLIPILLHGINNSVSILASAAVSSLPTEAVEAAQETAVTGNSSHLFVVYAGLGMILLMFGVRKLNRICINKEENVT